MNAHTRLFKYTLMFIAGLSTASVVGAQQDTDAAAEDIATDDVITVTAQFREQVSAEVPIAVTSYDQAFLDSVGVDKLDQLSAFVPGLQIQEQSVNNPGFVIRGITSDSGSAVIEPRVSVFQNGVSISRSRGSYVPLFDLERIEVMKGPQGTLFGRSAQIGAVHMITAKPEDRYEAETYFEFGNLAQQKFDGMVNIPTGESAVRLAATYRKRDGSIENLLGGELNGTDTFAVRGSWRVPFGQGGTFDLISTYVEDDAPGTSFKSGIIPALGGDNDFFTPASLNAFGGFLGGRELGTQRDIFDLTAIINYEFSNRWSVNATTAYREFDSFEAFDPDGTAFDLFYFGEDAQGEQFSSDVRFTFTPNDRLTAFFGGGVFMEEGSQSVPLGLDGSVVGALFQSIAATGPVVDGRAGFFGNPLLAQLFLTGNPAALAQGLAAGGIPTGLYQEEFFTNFSDNISYDVFADATFAATDRLELTAGLRYTRDDKESLYSAGVLNNNPFLGNLLVPDINTPVSSDDDPSVDNTFDGWAWRLNANYAFNDNQYGYINHARGRRPEVIGELPGQFNEALGAAVSFEVIPEERVDSYEIGYKVLFMDGRSQFDIAAFYYDYENFQTSIAVDAGPGVPPDFQTINAGTASSEGIETQLRVQATDYLEVFANYAYNKSRFDKQDADGNPLVFGGNRFRLSPDHTASIALNFSTEVGSSEFYFTPSMTYQSKVYFQDDNQEFYAVVDPATGAAIYQVPALSEDGYALFNLRAGVRFGDSGISLEAYVNNIADKDYLIDAGNTGNSFNIPTFIAGPPRLYGIGLNVTY